MASKTIADKMVWEFWRWAKMHYPDLRMKFLQELNPEDLE